MKHGRKDYNERVQDSAGIIPEDEPVFLLRAQDPIAVEVLKDYKRHYVAVVQEPDEEMLAQIDQQIAAFHAWQPKKAIPDMPKGEAEPAPDPTPGGSAEPPPSPPASPTTPEPTPPSDPDPAPSGEEDPENPPTE